MIRSVIAAIKCCVSIIIVICICPPRALIWLINLFLFLKKKESYKPLCKRESDNLWCRGKLLISIKRAMNSSRIELLWLVWDQSWSKYYLRTKFQDGIDKPQKCQNVCYHPTHQQQSDFLILVLYDFIVQNILSSLLLLCYNLMIMNDYE
jgi:hypothetical protein